MEELKLYTSRKKSFLFLVLLIALAGAFYYGIVEIDIEKRRGLGAKIACIVGLAFCIYGILLAIKRSVKNQVLITINERGINLRPNKIPEEIIEWKFIRGFHDFRFKGQKLIVVDLVNNDHFVRKQKNSILKGILNMNISQTGSPYNISAMPLQISYAELKNLLESNFNKYNTPHNPR